MGKREAALPKERGDKVQESINSINAATHFSEMRYILSQNWVLDFLINNCERFEPIEDAFARSVGDGDHNILL